MDSVLDFLFLRRLKFEYTTPPICPITLASASGLAITGQVISPILAMRAPFLQGRFLTWPCAPGQICFNIYSNQSGFLTEVATCIQPNSALVCSAGCWRASATVNGIEGPLTDPVCTDGTAIAVELPAQPGASYNLYHNPNPLDPFGDYTLALSGVFCGAFEICTVGCYSISAITGDGETPPSDPTCTGGTPTLSISTPHNGDSFFLPVSPVLIVGDANLNGHNPVKVEFFIDGVLLGTVLGSGPYQVSWPLSTGGSFTITATLTYDVSLTVDATPVVVSAAHALAVDLESYWKLEEPLGATRVDSVGTNDLNEVGGPLIYNGAGIIGDAAWFHGTAARGLGIASNPTLQMGAGKSFTFTTWAYMTDVQAVDQAILGKWRDDGGAPGVEGSEYRLFYSPDNGVLCNHIHVAATDINTALVVDVRSPVCVSQFLTPNPQWFFIACGFDNDAQQLWISINGEAKNTIACSGVIALSTPFNIGAKSQAAQNPFQSFAIDETGFWRRSLLDSEIAFLYGSGGPPTLETFYP